MGMGFLHYDEDRSFDKKDIKLGAAVTSLDYVQGRMVKLTIFRFKDAPNTWSTPHQPPTVDYQSWADVYRTYEDLIESAGITELEVIEDN